MFTFSSYKDGTQTIYERHTLDEQGNVVHSRTARFPFAYVEHDGFEYIIPYDDQLCPIAPAFDYLNFDMAERPVTSRRQAASALRILYCYLSLMHLDVNSIDADALRGLIRFIRGVGTIQEKFTMDTIRSNKTVNLYLATYRSFFKARDIYCDLLFKTMPTRGLNSSEDAQRKNPRMKSNRPVTAKEERNIPKYISLKQFHQLYKMAIEKKDLTAIVIMRLGYGYGLRLGEILGLTLEDVTEAKIDNQYIPIIYIRNRMTDKKFQYAKNLLHPTDQRQYHSKDYTGSRHRIQITENMYEWLLQYINQTHAAMQEKYPNNYKKTIADAVSASSDIEENHYVFLNRYGKILSDQTWSNSLKNYFIEAEIPLDNDIKEKNLSHRFRHGFAMYHAHFSKHPWTALKLRDAMRHRSIQSTLIYYNLTEEDERAEKEAMQNELYDTIPELKLLPRQFDEV